MKELILAIQSVLQEKMPFVKPHDVYVTEDVHLIRNAGGYPAIGIKDGSQSFTSLAGDQEDETLSVTIAVYVQLLKQEAGIMGDAGRKGVLDMSQSVVDALRDTTFDGLMSQATPITVGASEFLADETLALVMKTISMQYVR